MLIFLNVFHYLCLIFLSKNLDKNVNDSICNLESYLTCSSSSLDDIIIDSDTDSDCNAFENNENKTYREKSPFGRHYLKIFEFSNAKISKKEYLSNEINQCYNPQVIDYLLSYYLPLLPLWSAIILEPHSIKLGMKCDHYSNALIENWMRIVKIDILDSKTNLRPGDFINIMYPSIGSRLKAYNFACHPRANNIQGP